MYHIIADILHLFQHKTAFNEGLKLSHSACCPCGSVGLWLHGTYPRKADRSNVGEKSLNPIPIQRYYCPNCGKTCSALPECIPRHRWYLWEIQEAVFLLMLSGLSIRSIAKVVAPSRHTISRWFTRFKEQFLEHKNVLCSYMADLGRTDGFIDFWKMCSEKISLSKAMLLCHVSQVVVP